jgi:3,4-dihydroxy 2-butanone 4-phosphate synthase/GTP cyclohydrolase II
MNDDGSMARRPQLETLCKKHGIRMCSVADVIGYRLEREKLVQRIAEHPIINDTGEFRLIAYRSKVDPFPHVALVKGEVGLLDGAGAPIDQDQPILVRMHSQNLLGDVFGDTAQPTGQTLRQAMMMIERHGRGAVVYLRHEGMGRGLLKQLQTPTPLDGRGHDDDRPRIGGSHELPGPTPVISNMDYGIGSQILRDLGIRKIRLITSHPMTPAALSGFGLEIVDFIEPAAQ